MHFMAVQDDCEAEAETSSGRSTPPELRDLALRRPARRVARAASMPYNGYWSKKVAI